MNEPFFWVVIGLNSKGLSVTATLCEEKALRVVRDEVAERCTHTRVLPANVHESVEVTSD